MPDQMMVGGFKRFKSGPPAGLFFQKLHKQGMVVIAFMQTVDYCNLLRFIEYTEIDGTVMDEFRGKRSQRGVGHFKRP
jgi:hypothetical protein